MIPVSFELDIIGVVLLSVFALFAICMGVSVARAERRQKEAERLHAFRDALTLLDPTLVELAPVNAYRNHRGVRTLDISEVKRLAELQRTREAHTKDYTDLNEAKKRLKDAREEQR